MEIYGHWAWSWLLADHVLAFSALCTVQWLAHCATRFRLLSGWLSTWLATYYKTKKTCMCHFPCSPTVPTYSPCDETCPFIRSFHSSTLWSTEYSSNAECQYSPSLPCSNPTSIGRVWAPLNIRGRWTGSRGWCHEGLKFLLSLDVWTPSPFPYSHQQMSLTSFC